MLMCEATIGGTLYRFSDHWLRLDHVWRRKILSFSAPTITLSKEYGGRLALGDGKITFSPDFYPYPPPLTISMVLRRQEYGETGELMFRGEALLDQFDQTGASYRLYATPYTDEITKDTALSGTIIDTFTTGATALGLTLDSTNARTTPPAISFTATKDSLWVDLLTSIAEYCTHMFWIDEETDTLYLVDMSYINGVRAVGREFFQPAYNYPAPTSEVTARVGEDTFRAGAANGIGKTVTTTAYHTNKTTVETELNLILTAANTMRMSVSFPITNGVPLPNEKITAIDRKCGLNVFCMAQKFEFDFKRMIVSVSGFGGVEAL